jgi:hypothetical protein
MNRVSEDVIKRKDDIRRQGAASQISTIDSADELFAELMQPWPTWAKKAAGRLLNILLPSISANDWMEFFDTADSRLAAFEKLVEHPRVQGRFARFLAECKEHAPDEFAKFFLPERAIERDPRAKMLFQASNLPVEQQAVFWREFAAGFATKPFRDSDAKVMRIYLIVTLFWPWIRPCGSIREVYNLVFSLIPKEPCPADRDPVDHEERIFKWFEKICQRSLGLQLRQRGRPKKAPNG